VRVYTYTSVELPSLLRSAASVVYTTSVTKTEPFILVPCHSAGEARSGPPGRAGAA